MKVSVRRNGRIHLARAARRSSSVVAVAALTIAALPLAAEATPASAPSATASVRSAPAATAPAAPSSSPGALVTAAPAALPGLGKWGTLRITSAPKRVVLGDRIRVRAASSRALTGVVVLDRFRSGHWYRVAATKVVRSRYFSLTYTPVATGATHFRVRFTKSGASSVSPGFVVAVPTVGFRSALRAGTVAVPGTAVSAVWGNPKSTLYLRTVRALPGAKVGAILVGAPSRRAPGGILGRVQAVTRSGALRVYRLGPVAAEKAYRDYRVGVSGSLQQLSAFAQKSYRSMGMLDQARAWKQLSLAGLPVRCTSGLTTYDVSASLGDITPQLQASLSSGVEFFELRLHPTVTVGLGIGGKASCDLTLPVVPTIPLGGPFVLQLTPYASISAQGGVHVKVTVTTDAMVGYRKNGGAYKWFDAHPHATVDSGGDASAEIEAGGEASISAGGIVGIHVRSGVALMANLSINASTTCWGIGAELRASLFLSFDLGWIHQKWTPLKGAFGYKKVGEGCSAAGGGSVPPSAPIPAPPPGGGTGTPGSTFTIVGAGAGAVARTSPYLNAPARRTLGNGTRVAVTCQVAGDAVVYGGRPSVVWNNTADGDYVPDVFFDTPAPWAFSASLLPRCAGSPPRPGSGGSVPPPGTATGNYHVVNTGGLGLRFRTAPTTGAGVTRVLPDGTPVQVVCQIAGDSVTAFGRPSIVWNRTAQGDYATDIYFNTPGQWDFSSTLPRCEGGPPPTGYLHHVYNTGGLGLWFHSGPHLADGRTRILGEGTAITIVCQTWGDTVVDGYTSAVWDKTSNGDYASDLYIDTANIGTFSPPIPQC
jgi:hypothetical protein